MRTLLVTLAAAALTTGPALAATTGGSVRSEQGTIEILSPPAGPEIRTPEGFIRLEPGGPSGEGVGSFSVVPAGAFARPSPAPPRPVAPDERPESGLALAPPGPAFEPGGMVDTGAPSSGPDPCRYQRWRYARHLLRSAGIDVADPLALLQGLAGASAYGGDILSSGYLLSGIDPIRPLAWDMTLRSIARDLATCQSSTAAEPPE
jgi:hypothetical protein